MNNLTSKKCVPCEGGVPPLSPEQIELFRTELSDEAWRVSDNKKISKEFRFETFPQAMMFVNMVADLAEHEGHHPDIWISYNIVRLELWTHAIGGLSENDFILAAKINELGK